MNHGSHSNSWFGADDGRCQQLNHIIGRTILSALDIVQRVGQLHKDSKLRDLGLVMALFAENSLGTPEYGLETTLGNSLIGDNDRESEVEQTDWHETIVAYVMKADLDLKDVGVSGMVIRRDTEVEAFDGEDTDLGFASAVCYCNVASAVDQY